MTSRAIRIGVVLGDNLVEERMFVEGPVTLGQSLRCKLSVPVDGVPREHVLFVRDQGRWMLRQLDGAMAPVERDTRGKLRFGEATILYQEVVAPAAVPRPQLPASVRGTFADRIDRRLAVIIGGSLLVHVVIGAWAFATETEQPALFENRAIAEYRQDTYKIEVPDELPTVAEPTDVPGAATPVAPVQTPRPIVPRPIAPPAQMSTNDAERFAQILTNNTEQNGGRAEMGKRIPGAELGTQIADIRDNGRTIGNDQNGFRNKEREGLGTGPQITRNEPTQLEQQGPRTEHGGGRIDLRPEPKPPGDGPNPDGIIARIRNSYMQGLMRCYQIGLRNDGDLRGKIAVAFTVTETGKIADPTARGVSGEVDSCVATQMASWRFPIQKDKDGAPTDLDIKLSLALVPTN
jgi:hypothetical protein